MPHRTQNSDLMAHVQEVLSYQSYVLQKLKEIEVNTEKTKEDVKEIKQINKDLFNRVYENEKRHAVNEASSKTFYAAFSAIFGLIGALMIPLGQYLIDALKK